MSILRTIQYLRQPSVKAAATASCALAAIIAFSTAANAQNSPSAAPPVRQFVDENGVDVASGHIVARTPNISVGDEANGLSYDRIVAPGVYDDSYLGTAYSGGSSLVVVWGGKTIAFNLSGGVYTPVEQNGQSATMSGGTITYTARDGTVVTYATQGAYQFGNGKGDAVITSVVFPSGKRLDYYYTTVNTVDGSRGKRIQSIVSNTGYHLKWTYQADVISYASDGYKWAHLLAVKAFNELTDPCSTSANSCTGADHTAWPLQHPSISGGTYNATAQHINDPRGSTTYFTYGGYYNDRIVAVKLPGNLWDDYTIDYGTGDKVVSVATDLGITNYSYADASGIRTVTVTRGSNTRTYKVDIAAVQVTSVMDELSRETKFEYDSSKRLTKVTYPELNYTTYTYDGRGNLTATTDYPKPGSGGTLSRTSTFPSSCSNVVTCNKPSAVTDANGKTTDFTYDSTHGGLLTETLPAPTTGAVRPQSRYTYTRLDSSGASSIVGVFVVTGISRCQTNASCAGTVDEAKTTIAYGANLLPTSITEAAGDGSISATTTMTYDDLGNVVSVDGPLSGSADTTYFFTNLARIRTGTISADPDGGGSLPRRAVRTTYTVKGDVDKVQVGTVTGTTATDLAAITVAQDTRNTYDTMGRKKKTSLVSGVTTYAVTQYSYDGDGRLQCAAVRMNPATFASLPGSACTLTTAGTYGNDRITRTTYDAAGQVTKVQAAYGVAGVQADVATATYTGNGQEATVVDGEGNKTTFEYDAFDRLLKTRLPSSTQGSGTSSTTDYEQYTYDSNGNVTTRRLRDGNSIYLTYDALNRLPYKNLPGSEPDVTYVYNNFGRPISATDANGNFVSYLYDGLGRQTKETSPLGAVAMAYDLAGRRTLTSWTGGFYVTYDYLVTGELAHVRENGAGSGIGVLATYGYDSLGRRTSLTRGNGVVTTYGFDAVSRLTSLADNLSGTSYDVTRGFSYAPSSQIASNTRDNDAYAWPGSVNLNRNYTNNGLNQHTVSGSTSLGYDVRGNLTSSGSSSYGYSSQNLLTSGPGVTLGYDPLMRLYQTVGSSTTRFLYDGTRLAGEYNSAGTMTRRYIRGPGEDEVLVWYEIGDPTPRRWLSTDERGSVTAVTNDSAVQIAVNKYDEYGIPNGANIGRFQYTGQAWIPELGMSYYKARIYSPTLGRFMQTDPIGYEDGMNLYAYVGNDPVNRVDPSGQVGFELVFGTSTGMGADWAQITERLTALFDEITVTGRRPFEDLNAGGLTFGGRPEVDWGSFAGDQSWRGAVAAAAQASTPGKKQDDPLTRARKKYRELVAKLRACKTKQECAQAMKALNDFLNSAEGRLMRAEATNRHHDAFACAGGMAVAIVTKKGGGSTAGNAAKGAGGCFLGWAFQWFITGGRPDPLTDPDM